MTREALRIAILGTRGIPARYGGFETFAEELSTELVARGHKVTVFGRRRFFEKSPAEDTYRGVNTVSAPTIFHKYLETPLHGLMSFLKVSRRDYDVILLCNGANSPFAWILRLKGFPLFINVDGIERQRTKWNSLGKLWYQLGERCSVLFASRVVADAGVIRDYYLDTWHCDCAVIPYGARAKRRGPGELLSSFGIRERGYILYVSRLEPENNALGVVEAYAGLATELPLVIVGDAPYAQEYIARVKKAAEGKNVIFTGYQFGASYEELQTNCFLYIQATEVGGTHPALIEAMAYGNCVIANGTPENEEVLGESGILYSKNDFAELGGILRDLLKDPERVSRHGKAAALRATERYNWASIADEYEELFYALPDAAHIFHQSSGPAPHRRR